MRSFALLILILLPAAPAAGHELFLQCQGERLLLFHGHPDPGSEPDEPGQMCPDSALESVTAVTSRGAHVSTADPTTNGWPAKESALWITLRPEDWTHTRQGTVNAPPDSVAGPLGSWTSYESILWLGDASAWNFVPECEPARPRLLPTENPFEQRVGAKLTVRLTGGDVPIAGAVVTYHGKARGITDSDGRINIRLKRAGMQLLTATWVRSDPSGHCDEIVATTTLQFNLE